MSDDLEGTLERRLRDRFEDEVGTWDGSAARRAMDDIRSHGSSGPPRRLTGFLAPLAGALIVALVFGVIVATQRPSPGPAGPVSQASGATSPSLRPHKPTPSAPTASATATPTETTPTLSPTTPPSPVIHAGEFGRLLLPVPVFAETDASGEPIQLLERGRDLWAPQDAEVVDGSLWYRVQFRRLLGAGEYMFGWLPGIWEGQAVFRPYEPKCRADRPLSTLGVSGLTPPERLHCFGTEELRIVGKAQGFTGRQPYYGVRPGWLGMGAAFYLRGPTEFGAFEFQVDPASGVTAPASDFVRVTGHFDDPVSSDCVVEPPPGYPVLLPGESEAWCRQRFVVTNMEPSTDPSAP